MENFWSTCLSRFEQELSKQQYNTWIKPLVAEVNGNVLRLVAPNRFVLQWVKDRFNKKIEQFARELQLNVIQIDFVIANKLEGVYNAVAPHPVTNKEFIKSIAKVLHRPLFLPPVPQFFMKLVLGEMASVIFESQQVSSQKIQNAGFKFQFSKLHPALLSLFKK